MIKKQSNEELLDTYAKHLEDRFQRWDHIYKYGTLDHYADGVNIDLVRNHIIYYKKQIEEIVQQDQEELSLFPLDYPDIYNRPTPQKLPYDFMANPEGIRSRAHEQMALYEKDENFHFIEEHAIKAFPNGAGDHAAIRKEGLVPYHIFGLHRFKDSIEKDDLPTMRNLFYEPYEKKAAVWKESAEKLRSLLNREYTSSEALKTTSKHLSFDEQLAGAKVRFEQASKETVQNCVHTPSREISN